MSKNQEPRKRGELRNPEYATQERDFSKLRWGNITPSDLDLSADFERGKYFLWGEYKYRFGTMPTGQRMHLEALAQLAHDAGRKFLVFLAEHSNKYPRKIRAHRAKVTAYIEDGRHLNRPSAQRWREPNSELGPLTVEELITLKLAEWGINPETGREAEL